MELWYLIRTLRVGQESQQKRSNKASSTELTNFKESIGARTMMMAQYLSVCAVPTALLTQRITANTPYQLQ